MLVLFGKQYRCTFCAAINLSIAAYSKISCINNFSKTKTFIQIGNLGFLDTDWDSDELVSHELTQNPISQYKRAVNGLQGELL
jgi:hypothetical protein